MNLTFSRPNILKRKAKLLLWGCAGTGKTVLALHFPSPVVIDLEKGAGPYVDILPYDTPDVELVTMNHVMNTVEWLASNNHSYQTLIIDSLTVLWAMHQKRWNDTMFRCRRPEPGYKKPAGFKGEFYIFQTGDWLPIKGEWNRFIRSLTRLDMNVVVTAHSKTLYKEGEMMKAVGTTFSAEKDSDYVFDTVLKLEFIAGKPLYRKITCKRDRFKRWQAGETFTGTEDQLSKALLKCLCSETKEK